MRLGLSLQRNNLLELRATFCKMPSIAKGACEELSQLFVVVDRTYADYYRGQLQEVRFSRFAFSVFMINATCSALVRTVSTSSCSLRTKIGSPHSTASCGLKKARIDVERQKLTARAR